MALKAIGCPKETLCSEKRGLGVRLTREGLCYLMREYRKERPIKETDKDKLKELEVYQENLVSKRGNGRKCFKKEVFHDIESC